MMSHPLVRCSSSHEWTGLVRLGDKRGVDLAWAVGSAISQSVMQFCSHEPLELGTPLSSYNK